MRTSPALDNSNLFAVAESAVNLKATLGRFGATGIDHNGVIAVSTQLSKAHKAIVIGVLAKDFALTREFKESAISVRVVRDIPLSNDARIRIWDRVITRFHKAQQSVTQAIKDATGYAMDPQELPDPVEF